MGTPTALYRRDRNKERDLIFLTDSGGQSYLGFVAFGLIFSRETS
jgi:hypothetical protein